jgi:hypothetical protein
VLVLVKETPLKASVRVLVFIAAPNRERMALELVNEMNKSWPRLVVSMSFDLSKSERV